jgi:hypothetical protein
MTTKDRTADFIKTKLERKSNDISYDAIENKLDSNSDIEQIHITFGELLTNMEKLIRKLREIYFDPFYDSNKAKLVEEKSLINKISQSNELSVAYMKLLHHKHSCAEEGESKLICERLITAFQNRLKAINKSMRSAKTERTAITLDEPVHDAPHTYDSTMTQEQLFELDKLHAAASERAVAIAKLCDDINQLAELTQELNTMVTQHGTVLDNLDQKIHTTKKTVDKANEELIGANKHAKNSAKTRNILIGAAITGVVGLSVPLAMKS